MLLWGDSQDEAATDEKKNVNIEYKIFFFLTTRYSVDSILIKLIKKFHKVTNKERKLYIF